MLNAHLFVDSQVKQLVLIMAKLIKLSFQQLMLLLHDLHILEKLILDCLSARAINRNFCIFLFFVVTTSLPHLLQTCNVLALHLP